MAGTLTFEVETFHIYQRRFDSEELRHALTDCHLYIISRRPRVRLEQSSALCRPYAARVFARSRVEGGEEDRRYKVVIPSPEREPLADLRIHAYGSYLSIKAGSHLLHGDVWSFSSFFTGAHSDIAGQEVMYVGQAYGEDGSRNVWTRTEAHEKLQRIYEDHLTDDWDVFLAPLRLTTAMCGSDDHIDDEEEGPTLFGGYYGVFVDERDRRTPLKAAIDLVEHGLISYFVPPYNRRLIEWRAHEPTEDMRKMRAVGFRLLQIHLDGWWGLARFYSETVPSRVRSHLISHDIPPKPGILAAPGVTAQQLSEYRGHAHMVRVGHERLSTKAESAGTALRIFGESAPAIRRPPEVRFQ